MYDNIKYLGMPLSEWKEKIFHNTVSLGELHRMIKDGIDLSKVANCSLSCDISR